MSLLPQSKKSAEEIAKLREDFGIPSQAPEETETSAEAATSPVPAELEPMDSLKKSERSEVSSKEASAAAAAPISSDSPAAAQLPKKVRSLRKSEQVPLPAQAPEPSPNSSLPFHRHSDDEIMRIRRQEMFAMQPAQAVHPRLIAAHFALVIPGYLFAIAGWVCFYFYDQPIVATGACVVAALLVAGFIFLKKPLSQHHAAFISVIGLFVLVFGALHYFPQLRHGS